MSVLVLRFQEGTRELITFVADFSGGAVTDFLQDAGSGGAFEIALEPEG